MSKKSLTSIKALAGQTIQVVRRCSKKRTKTHFAFWVQLKKEKLVGVVRVVGDGISIVFVQDILVLPKYQRQGVGSALMRAVLEKYASVYQVELLTDSTEKSKAFYSSVGLAPVSELGCSAYIRMSAQ